MGQIAKLIAQNIPRYQQLLNHVIEIPSVKGKATAEAPFGKGPKAALDQALKIATDFGLKTGKVDDRVSWAQLNGQTDEHIAVFGHLE